MRACLKPVRTARSRRPGVRTHWAKRRNGDKVHESNLEQIRLANEKTMSYIIASIIASV